MKNLFIKSIILATLWLPLSLNAMVSYHLIKTPNEKHLLILGENHSINDTTLKNRFHNFMQSILNASLTESLPFIVEYENTHKSSVLQSTSIAQIVQLKNYLQRVNNTSLDIIYYEPRGIESSYLESHMFLLAELATTGVPSDHIIEHYQYQDNDRNSERINASRGAQNNSFPDLINQLMQVHIREQFPTTIEDYQAYLESNRKKITYLLEKYADNPLLVEIINKELSTYQQGLTSINKLFKNYTPKDRFFSACVHLFSNCTSRDEQLSRFDLMNDIFCTKTDYLYADLLFLDKVLDTLTSKKCVCILVGSAHATKLAHYFKHLNSTTLSTRDGFNINKPLLTGFNATILETLLTPELAQQFLEPVTKKSCTTCNATQALKKCSRCKKVWYCSKQCQINNWNSHKTVCKKL